MAFTAALTILGSIGNDEAIGAGKLTLPTVTGVGLDLPLQPTERAAGSHEQQAEATEEGSVRHQPCVRPAAAAMSSEELGKMPNTSTNTAARISAATTKPERIGVAIGAPGSGSRMYM